jgi:hypothetical protein
MERHAFNSSVVMSPGLMSDTTTSSDAGAPLPVSLATYTGPVGKSSMRSGGRLQDYTGEYENLSTSSLTQQRKSMASTQHKKNNVNDAGQWDLDHLRASSTSSSVLSDDHEHTSLSITSDGSLLGNATFERDDWEANAIIGQKCIEGRMYYLVAWKPTFEPEENLSNMRALIDEWNQNVESAKRSTIRGLRSNGNRNTFRNDKIETRPNRGRGRPRRVRRDS